jgi:hypothetical protein
MPASGVAKRFKNIDMSNLPGSANFSPILLAVLLTAAGAPILAQDNVTVPRSRLEELERKEKELDKLKGGPGKSEIHDAQPKTQNEKPSMKPVVAPPPEPAVSFVSPALESLPAVHPYDTVESMDLANYYHADVGSADRRFRKQKLIVRGEIVGFEKPLYKRNYRILLKSPIRETKVICDFLPPDKANAIFTTKHGDELVALFGESRVPIAHVGQTAVVKGECKGISESAVMILSWDLQLSQ